VVAPDEDFEVVARATQNTVDYAAIVVEHWE
jgi:hypothetical protein